MSEVPSAAPAAVSASAADASTTTPEINTVADAANEVAADASPAQEDSSETGTAKEEAPVAPTKEEIKAAIKKWKLKSGGKEREVTDEAEMVRLAQLGLGANEKFAEAAKTRQEAEQVLALLQTNPAEALKRLGMDVRKLAEDYLYQEIQNEKLTPEQKKFKEMELELEKYKAEKAEIQQKQEAERLQKLTAEYETSLQDNILKAIDQYKLPKNPRTVARIAEYMHKALENGYSVDPLDVAPRVRADLEEEHKSLYSQYNVEDLLKIIGEDKLKEIRAYEVNKVKAKAPQQPTKTDPVVHQPKVEESEKPKKAITIQQMMDQIQKELDGK